MVWRNRVMCTRSSRAASSAGDGARICTGAATGVGAAADAPTLHSEVDLKGPLALVLGAEGSGMRRLTRDTCDILVSIPMFGSVESLNVSVASGVCLYEARRQRLAKEAA